MSYPVKIYRFPEEMGYDYEWVSIYNEEEFDVWDFNNKLELSDIQKHKLDKVEDYCIDDEWYEFAQHCLNGKFDDFIVWRARKEKQEKTIVDNTQPNSPTFWIVWNPEYWKVPSFRHMTRWSAEDEAKRLAGSHPGQEFYVCMIESKFVSNNVIRTQFEESEDDSVPF